MSQCLGKVFIVKSPQFVNISLYLSVVNSVHVEDLYLSVIPFISAVAITMSPSAPSFMISTRLVICDVFSPFRKERLFCLAFAIRCTGLILCARSHWYLLGGPLLMLPLCLDHAEVLDPEHTLS